MTYDPIEYAQWLHEQNQLEWSSKMEWERCRPDALKSR